MLEGGFGKSSCALSKRWQASEEQAKPSNPELAPCVCSWQDQQEASMCCVHHA